MTKSTTETIKIQTKLNPPDHVCPDCLGTLQPVGKYAVCPYCEAVMTMVNGELIAVAVG